MEADNAALAKMLEHTRSLVRESSSSRSPSRARARR